MDSTSYDTQWRAWPVAWSAVWVGALAALVTGLIIGLIGFAVGAHEASRFVKWSNVKFITKVHTSTKRDYLQRVIETDKAERAEVACQFGK